MKPKTETPILQVHDLDIARGENLLVEGVSFTMQPGDTLWVAGRNGIGKTSLLRCMAALLRPESGEVMWRGENVHRHPPIGIGYQGHQDGHKPHLSVRENLAFWASIHKSDKGLGAILQQVGLAKRAGIRAQGLSAGQSRRLALARLLLSGADLWILDEPTAAMDKVGQDLIDGLIRAHVESGGLAIIASHTPPRKIGKHSRILTLGNIGEQVDA